MARTFGGFFLGLLMEAPDEVEARETMLAREVLLSSEQVDLVSEVSVPTAVLASDIVSTSVFCMATCGRTGQIVRVIG